MNKLIHGDCLEKLKELENNSIDLIVTDPPYGYSFMGKDWDKALPSVEIWRECLRVLKAGGFAYVMSAPRQDVLARMMINLEDSGFNTDFTSMYWAYATGFPKAMNVGKAVDKKLGVKGKVIGQGTAGSGFNKVKGFGVNTTKGGEATKVWDEHGIKSDEAKKLDGSYAGFSPKPAVEVIIVCMKPLDEKTYIGQAMKDGKGVSWFDDCRVPLSKDTSIEDKRLVEGGSWDTSKTAENIYEGGYEGKRISAPMRNSDQYDLERRKVSKATGVKEDGSFLDQIHDADAKHGIVPAGRFPANLIVSDDALNNGVESKSIRSKRGGSIGTNNSTDKYEGGWKEMETFDCGYNDKGSFSRYYDLDAWYSQFIITPKASKSEKNKGCENLKEKFQAGAGYRPSNMKVALEGGSGKPYARYDKMKNIHPTVKPLKLMSYLITLGSRESDIVLDPFMGSGTTPLACKNLNRRYIGIELNKEYFEICKARVEGGITLDKFC